MATKTFVQKLKSNEFAFTLGAALVAFMLAIVLGIVGISEKRQLLSSSTTTTATDFEQSVVPQRDTSTSTSN